MGHRSLNVSDLNEAEIFFFFLKIIALMHQWQHRCSSFERRKFFFFFPKEKEDERMVIHYAFRRTLRPDVDEVDVQSSPSQMDSNSAVSSSREHGIGTAGNEERSEKTRGRGGGGRRGSALQACPLDVVVGDGGEGGERGEARLHSCFHIPGQVQEGSRVH